jgi:hypothetical protein
MEKDICTSIKRHNHRVAWELRRAEKSDFISLTSLLIVKEKIIKEIYEARL